MGGALIEKYEGVKAWKHELNQRNLTFHDTSPLQALEVSALKDVY